LRRPRKSLRRPHKPSLLEELVLGFIAGMASRLITTPLNVITLRIQTEREDEESEDVDPEATQPLGVTDVMKLIYSEQGFVGFWRGFQTTTLLSLNPSMTLAFLQMYRRLLSVLKSTSFDLLASRGFAAVKQAPTNANQNLHPWEAFFGGAISNSIAVFLLYPLILAKTRLQVSKETTMTSVLADAYMGKNPKMGKRTESKGKGKAPEKDDEGPAGIPALYQGLEVKILKGFLSQGVTFLIKGR
jgi:adenine nucleotide transporter 17